MRLLVLPSAPPVLTRHDSPRAIIRECSAKQTHVIAVGAPDEWAMSRGATHTMIMPNPERPGVGPTRPVVVANRSTIYVGVDETPEGLIEWEKWTVKMTACDFATLLPA